MDVGFGCMLVFALLLQTVNAELKMSSLTKLEDVLESEFFGRRKFSEFRKLNPFTIKEAVLQHQIAPVKSGRSHEMESEAIIKTEATRHLMKKTGKTAEVLMADEVNNDAFRELVCPSSTVRCTPSEYRTMNGSCNNVKNPDLGQSFTTHRRFLPPVYVYEECDGIGLAFSKDMFIVNNAETNITDEHRSLATLPVGLSIRPSEIPEAGYGVFAERSFPKGTRFGPYSGEITQNVDDCSYAWTVVSDDNSVKHYVDGYYKNNSNWLRYVNCPRTVHEENLYVLQLNNEIFYVTYECITPGTELLVWYGPDYGEDLGLQRKPEDYQERFNEEDIRYVIENTILENVHQLYAHCYKFFNQTPLINPPGKEGTFDRYCFYDGSYQVCRFSECYENPCTNQTDCRSCEGYCLHLGKYFKAIEKFKHVDTKNTCVCNEDGHFACTIFAQFPEYICS